MPTTTSALLGPCASHGPIPLWTVNTGVRPAWARSISQTGVATPMRTSATAAAHRIVAARFRPASGSSWTWSTTGTPRLRAIVASGSMSSELAWTRSGRARSSQLAKVRR